MALSREEKISVLKKMQAGSLTREEKIQLLKNMRGGSLTEPTGQAAAQVTAQAPPKPQPLSFEQEIQRPERLGAPQATLDIPEPQAKSRVTGVERALLPSLTESKTISSPSQAIFPGLEIPQSTREVGEKMTPGKLATAPLEFMGAGARALGAVAEKTGVSDVLRGSLGDKGPGLNDVIKGDVKPKRDKSILELMRNPELGALKPVREAVSRTTEKLPGLVKTPLRFATDIGTGILEDPAGVPRAAIKGTLGALRKAGPALKKTAEAPGKLAGRLSEEMSGVSEETLREAGTKAGRKGLQEASGKQFEIGQELIDLIESGSKNIPEGEAVKKALKQMGDMSLKDAKEALEASKVSPIGGRLLPNEKAANKKIDKFVDILSEGPEKAAKVSAEEFRDFRKRFDTSVDFSTSKGSNIVNKALKNTRTAMKDALIDQAKKSGNEEYISAMKTMSDKLTKFEEIKSLLSADPKKAKQRAEAFVDRLFGKNNTHKQQLIEDLDQIYGGEILKKTKAAAQAGELGKGGKASLLPRQFTGRSLLGFAIAPGVSIPFSSPFIASRVTLPVAEKIEKAIVKTGKALTDTQSETFAKIMNAKDKAAKVRLATVLERSILGEKDDDKEK